MDLKCPHTKTANYCFVILYYLDEDEDDDNLAWGWVIVTGIYYIVTVYNDDNFININILFSYSKSEQKLVGNYIQIFSVHCSVIFILAYE